MKLRHFKAKLILLLALIVAVSLFLFALWKLTAETCPICKGCGGYLEDSGDMLKNVKCDRCHGKGHL